MAEMRRWLSAVLLGWIIFLGACSPDPGSQQTPQIQTQDSVSAPTGRAIGVRGVLEPARWVELSFGREGRVLEVLVEPGEMVEADQPLAKLDDRQARQAVARAEANLTLAQAELANLVAEPSAEELAVAEAQLAVVEAQLEDALRLSSIVAGAQAEVLLQEARMADFLAGADEFERALAEARLAQAELLYDQALADLDMLVLKAPFSGRIAQVSVRPQAFVRTDTPAILIWQSVSWLVQAGPINDLDIPDMQLGKEVLVRIDAIEGQPYNGRIESLTPRLEDGGFANSYLIVRLDSAAPEFWWGQEALVTIERNP